MPINDGGPAFPTETYMDKGMTLRDYFAGQALQQFVDQRDHQVWSHEKSVEDRKTIAAAAYNIADAMIEARNRKDDDATN